MTPISNTSLLRSEIRERLRQVRRELSIAQQQRFAQQAAKRVLSYEPVTNATRIAVFLSFDGELDTAPLIDGLWQAGKEVYLPALHPFSEGNLLFLRYTPDSQLIMNRLKIQEPVLNVRNILPLANLDILITPLVAFDIHGQRLGMGGGFYDRTLQNWQTYPVYPIGFAYDFQQLPSLPVQAWDIPLPAVITPGKVWQW